MARHVAERAAAEVEEAAPGEGVVHVLAELPGIVHVRVVGILVQERTLRRRGEPRVPVEAVANLLALGMALHPLRDILALRPHGAVCPHVDFRDVAEDAALDHFRAAAHRIEGRTLVAHLDDHAVLLGRLVEVVEFPERAHERLLHVHVDALLHRADRDGSVDVVGRGDGHRVDAEEGARVEKLAVVREEGNFVHVEVNAVLRQTQLGRFAGLVVGVAERDDVHEAALEHRRPVAVALAHHAHDCEANLVAAAAPRVAAAAGRQGRDARRALEESSSVSVELHDFPLLVLFSAYSGAKSSLNFTRKSVRRQASFFSKVLFSLVAFRAERLVGGRISGGRRTGGSPSAQDVSCFRPFDAPLQFSTCERRGNGL